MYSDFRPRPNDAAGFRSHRRLDPPPVIPPEETQVSNLSEAAQEATFMKDYPLTAFDELTKDINQFPFYYGFDRRMPSNTRSAYMNHDNGVRIIQREGITRFILNATPESIRAFHDGARQPNPDYNAIINALSRGNVDGNRLVIDIGIDAEQLTTVAQSEQWNPASKQFDQGQRSLVNPTLFAAFFSSLEQSRYQHRNQIVFSLPQHDSGGEPRNGRHNKTPGPTSMTVIGGGFSTVFHEGPKQQQSGPKSSAERKRLHENQKNAKRKK